MKEIKLAPVGFVSSPAVKQTDENRGQIISHIFLQSEFIGAFSGPEEFLHAIIVTCLYQSKYEKAEHLQRRPVGLEGMPGIGIFSQRAKDRPNPIVASAAKIVSVGDYHLEVQGLDAVDQTPVLDIKPYYPHYDKIDSSEVPDWVSRLMGNYF